MQGIGRARSEAEEQPEDQTTARECVDKTDARGVVMLPLDLGEQK
jgi:hypothetical protein